MAHLLEHLNFIETTNGRQIKKEIVDRGAQWNGTTSSDRTNYYETVTATDENLKWALGLEADRMANVKFTKQILDTEMTVVRNEFERGENSPERVLRERVEATGISVAQLRQVDHRIERGSGARADRPPGLRSTRKYYRPDNAVLVITGRLDESKTLQFVADTFGKIARPRTPVEQTYTMEPAQDGERYVELRRVGQGQVVLLAYHGPAAGHPDSAALQVLSGIMSGGGGGRGGGRGGRGGGGGGEGRLTKAVVDTKLAESASMGAQLQHDPGLVVLSANLNKDQSLDAARKALIDALADVLKNPPTKEEVDRVRTGLLRNLERSLSDPQSIATGALNTAIAQGDWRLMFLQHDRLEDVGPSGCAPCGPGVFQSVESNRRLLHSRRRAGSDHRSAHAGSRFAARQLLEQGHDFEAERFDPTPANIEARVVRSKLANGMKVVVLPKETANSLVLATIDLRFGDATTLKGSEHRGAIRRIADPARWNQEPHAAAVAG
jgi:zinc protease